MRVVEPEYPSQLSSLFRIRVGAKQRQIVAIVYYRNSMSRYNFICAYEFIRLRLRDHDCASGQPVKGSLDREPNSSLNRAKVTVEHVPMISVHAHGNSQHCRRQTAEGACLGGMRMHYLRFFLA